jgi:hypothetical protein
VSRIDELIDLIDYLEIQLVEAEAELTSLEFEDELDMEELWDAQDFLYDSSKGN